MDEQLKQQFVKLLAGLLNQQLSYGDFCEQFRDAWWPVIDNGGRELVGWENNLAGVHLCIHEQEDGFQTLQDVYIEAQRALDCCEGG